jgi:ketopantoate hydroxymethyltransferase
VSGPPDTGDGCGCGFDDLRPRFVKQYADLGPAIVRAAEAYCREVRDGSSR